MRRINYDDALKLYYEGRKPTLEELAGTFRVDILDGMTSFYHLGHIKVIGKGRGYNQVLGKKMGFFQIEMGIDEAWFIYPPEKNTGIMSLIWKYYDTVRIGLIKEDDGKEFEVISGKIWTKETRELKGIFTMYRVH